MLCLFRSRRNATVCIQALLKSLSPFDADATSSILQVESLLQAHNVGNFGKTVSSNNKLHVTVLGFIVALLRYFNDAYRNTYLSYLCCCLEIQLF